MLKRPSSARRAQIKMLKMPLAGSTAENACGIKMKNAWDASNQILSWASLTRSLSAGDK